MRVMHVAIVAALAGFGHVDAIGQTSCPDFARSPAALIADLQEGGVRFDKLSNQLADDIYRETRGYGWYPELADLGRILTGKFYKENEFRDALSCVYGVKFEEAIVLFEVVLGADSIVDLGWEILPTRGDRPPLDPRKPIAPSGEDRQIPRAPITPSRPPSTQSFPSSPTGNDADACAMFPNLC